MYDSSSGITSIRAVYCEWETVPQWTRLYSVPYKDQQSVNYISDQCNCVATLMTVSLSITLSRHFHVEVKILGVIYGCKETIEFKINSTSICNSRYCWNIYVLHVHFSFTGINIILVMYSLQSLGSLQTITKGCCLLYCCYTPLFCLLSNNIVISLYTHTFAYFRLTEL